MSAYFDHNATTPIDPRVFEAMLPWMTERHGNPSSVHRFGQDARNAVEEAREKIAALVGADPLEVVFTATGTEANNAVLFEVAGRTGFSGHVVISSFEHPSVLRGAEVLAAGGMSVSSVDPDSDGVVAASEVIAALRDETRVVSLMLANNEIGTLQPVAEVAAECRRRGIPILTDAVQAAGKVPVEVQELGIDFLTLGAHKFHGPLGAAALWIRSGAEFEPLLVGGGQERRRRAGTENVPAVVGFGEAAALATAELPERRASLAALRDRFESGVRRIEGHVVHGLRAPRLPNTSHVAFPGLEGAAILVRLDLAGYAVSTGAACGSGVVEPSTAMKAMKIPFDEAVASLRVSFGIDNDEAQVDGLVSALAEAVAEMRGLDSSPALEPSLQASK